MIPLTHSFFCPSIFPFLAVGGVVLLIAGGICFAHFDDLEQNWKANISFGAVVLGIVSLLFSVVIMVFSMLMINRMANNSPIHQTTWTEQFVAPSQEKAWMKEQDYIADGKDTQGRDLFKTADGKVHVNCTVNYKEHLVHKDSTWYAQPLLTCDN